MLSLLAWLAVQKPAKTNPNRCSQSRHYLKIYLKALVAENIRAINLAWKCKTRKPQSFLSRKCD